MYITRTRDSRMSNPETAYGPCSPASSQQDCAASCVRHHVAGVNGGCMSSSAPMRGMEWVNGTMANSHQVAFDAEFPLSADVGVCAQLSKGKNMSSIEHQKKGEKPALMREGSCNTPTTLHKGLLGVREWSLGNVRWCVGGRLACCDGGRGRGRTTALHAV